MKSAPVLVVFVVTALALALTAGFGLGLWLLLARTSGLSMFGIAWPVLVQVHGTIQLFGFATIFLMGVSLSALPRFRAAPAPSRPLVGLVLASTVTAIGLRAIAQPFPTMPARDALLTASSALLVLGSLAFATAGLRTLRGGTNTHRPDELVMAAGLAAAPIGALFVALELPLAGAPLLVDQAADDRAVWIMLLGCLGTAILGVWTRLAPGFIASPPSRPGPLLAGTAIWLAGVVALVGSLPIAGALVLAGLVVVTWATGVFGTSIARQPLAGHARLTRLAVRSAFTWALAGGTLLALYGARAALGTASSYLELSAVRHAFGLGFVTLMIYGVAARVLPSFLDRSVWSERSQLAVIVLADLGVGLRVVPQVVMTAPDSGVANDLIAVSGVLAYLALAVFALNVLLMLRRPALPRAPLGPSPITVRFR